MAKSTKPKSATSFRETAFGIISRSQLIPLEAQGVKKALEYIIKMGNTKSPITPDLIKDIHKVGFGFIFPNWAGKFRLIEVTVGTYTPPPYYKLPQLVKILCDDLAERLKHLPSSFEQEQYLAEMVSLLAWFQHRLVWIHPFQDYNGRIARLLTNLLLLNLDLPIIEIKADTKEDRKRYIKAMKEADKGNLTKLEYLLAQALKENLENLE